MLVKSKCFWSQFKSLLELTRHTRQTECKILASCWFSCCSLEHYERFNSHQTSYHMKSSSQGVSGGWREFKPSPYIYMYCTYGLRTEIKFHFLFNILIQSFQNLLPNSFSKGNSKHINIYIYYDLQRINSVFQWSDITEILKSQNISSTTIVLFVKFGFLTVFE